MINTYNNKNYRFHIIVAYLISSDMYKYNKRRVYSTHKPQWLKPKIKSLYFDFNEFYYDGFRETILDSFKDDVIYSLLVKLSYGDSAYGMLSHQIPFHFILSEADYKIKILFNDIVNLIINFGEKYRIELDEIDVIQVLYIVMTDIPELKLKNINKIKLPRSFFPIKDTKQNYNSTFLPLTCETKYYGKLLTTEYEINKHLNLINNVLSLSNITKITNSDYDSVYVLNNLYIILNKDLGSNNYNRSVYSANSGLLYFKAFDNIINENTFTRTIGNSIFTINNDNIIKISSVKNLNYIKYRDTPYKAASNPFIGTLDLETFVDSDNYSKVYSLGFYTKLEADKNLDPIVYYLNDNDESKDLILKCIDTMLSNKYDGYTFYTHNFGGFDSVFILNALIRANEEIGYDYYKLVPEFRDSRRLLKLDIKVNKPVNFYNVISDLNKGLNNLSKVLDYLNKSLNYLRKPTTYKFKSILKYDNIKIPNKYGFNKISIFDSYNILSDNLFDLSRSFKVNVVKGFFPHTFVKRDTLNYIGNTPSIEFWEDMDIDTYKNIYISNWNLKSECIKYLNLDLISLYNVMLTFNKYVYANFGLQMTNSLTISRLSINLYLKHYLKEHKIPVIDKNIYSDIKKAYFGGLTEVYRPYGKDLYYYDVNSLYPYVALNPMPGISCTYIEDFSGGGLDINNLFGYYYCEVETTNNYLGLLPVHTDIGLIMPNGKWSGWYFSEELKFAVNNGYKVKIIKGYSFNKELNVFTEFVNDLYKIKSTNTDSIKLMAKSLLNNLLGRFGMNINKPITEIMNWEKLNKILFTREVNSPINITDNSVLVNYYPKVSKNICNAFELDYTKVLNSEHNNNNIETEGMFNDVSLVIAASVTSYARIYMSKIKLDILLRGGLIYYTDTDSIVTNIPLLPNQVGDELGQLKLERIKEGYFISSKTYCLIRENGNTIIKTKGLNNKSITIDDFKDMYKGLKVVGKKKHAVTNYDKGSVVIKSDKITLDYNSYKKRDKIYENNTWVNTKPIYHNSNLIANKRINNNTTTPKSVKVYNNNKINLNKYSTINKLKDKMSLIKFLKQNYINIILSLLLLIFSCYLIPQLIDNFITFYNNYTIELNNIKANHLRYIIDNKISYKGNIGNHLSMNCVKLHKPYNTMNVFKSEYIEFFNKPIKILSPILKDINFNTIDTPINIYVSPLLTQTNLSDYMLGSTVNTDINHINPLGIQGLNRRNIDELINIVDNLIIEHNVHKQELLNYQSNLMYIIINKLSPSLY